MIVVNMWFIRHSNGLFHYGLDYAEALGDTVREIWVRSEALAATVSSRLPAADVQVLTKWQFLSRILCLWRRADLVFTPSAHPLALLRRQVVVVHDSFPFAGGRGAIKLALFRMGLALSGGAAAYINRADGLRFLERCGVAGGRLHYLPNRVGDPVSSPANSVLTLGKGLVVGLFGSDSPKKNYDALFTAVQASERGIPVSWRIYGHPNAYTDRLRAVYPGLAIEVVASDAMQMHEFIRSIDIAASVAEGEGFARPIALALMNGTPTFLLDTPVFREFYAGSARMFETPKALVSELAALRSGQELDRPRLVSEGLLRRDFRAGVAWLKAR